MRNFFRIAALLLLGGGWCLAPKPSFGSEARVDSAGGLTTLMTDETTDLSFFMDGNPAGLVLLDHKDRADLSGQWFYSIAEPSAVGSVQQTLSTLPRLSEPNSFHYEGVMVFPEPGWAVQVGGDFLASQGQPIFTNDTYTLSQYRGLLRTAYDLGPVALGLELLTTQSDQHFDPGLFDPPALGGPYFGLQSGSSGQDQTVIRGGFVTTFPEKPADDQGRWQAGGYVGAQLGSSTETQDLSLFTLGSSAFPISRTMNLVDHYTFDPEIRYEVPGRFILRFSYIMTYWDQDFSQTVPAGTPLLTSIASFRATQFRSMNANGEFKVMEPLSDKETLKIGGSLASYTNDTDLLNPDQSLYDSQNKQWINATLGVGLESLYDYLYGIQFKTQNYLHDVPSTNNTDNNSPADFDSYQLAVGGEKWLSSNWAFRLGLIVETDIYGQGSHLQTLNTTVTAGVGYESLFWKADLKMVAGQTVDINDSSNTSTQTGAQLAGTLFL